MASVFGHTILGATLGKLLLPERRFAGWWAVAAACAFLPDADAIGYKLGVAYGSLWGHRGMTHSLLAAVVVATVVAGLAQLRRRESVPPLGRLWVTLFLATASHGVLDAATTGGLGVAFFSPFELERFFFPLRPIRVSPIGIRAFFGSWGVRVLLSEAVWVALPCALLLSVQAGWTRRYKLN